MRRLGSLLLLGSALFPACAHAAGSAVLQDASHQVTISDHVHGSMMLAPSVFLSPNSPGILNLSSGNPLILQKGVATTGADAGDFRFDRNANYVGGAHGFVNPALFGNCTVSAGVTAFEWCGLFKLRNSSSAADLGENVALYTQSHKDNGGSTWALVAELQDHNANPTTPSVTLEFDLQTKGTDVNGARVIQDLWGKSDDGLATVISNGMRFNTDTHTTLTNGLTFQGATISNAAIALGAGQKLCLDGLACANYLSQSAGSITIAATAGGAGASTVTGIGISTPGVTAINLDASNRLTVASSKKVCLDGTACAYYWMQSGGTSTYNTPTGAILTLTSGGSVSAFGDLGTFAGNISLASGKKLCLDGSTCTNYLTQSGGTFSLFGALNAKGNITADGQAAGATLMATGAAGQFKLLRLATAGVTRWDVNANNTAESGANAGADFNINRFDDAGTYLGTPIAINRATGNLTFATSSGTALSVTGLATSMLAATATTLDAATRVTVPTNNPVCLDGTTCNITVKFDGTSIIFANAGTARFQINMSTGTAGPSGAVTSGVSTGVNCSGAPTGSHQTVGGVTTVC